MSDTDTALGGFGDILRRAQAESDHATQRIREDTAQRQASAWQNIQASRATWPENRPPEPAADVDALREALRRALNDQRVAQERLRAAFDAGQRAEEHRTAVRRRLGVLDEVERRHAARLASILRAGGSGDQLSPEVATARTQRPGLDRDAQSADEACSTLSADVVRAQGEVDSATAQVNAAAKMIMSSTARAIVDKIAEHEQAAAELWRTIEPLGLLYFAGAKGTPGSPVALDEATRKIFSSRPRLGGVDNIPPAIRTARATAATDRWKAFFAALLVDAEAELETEAA